MNSKKPLYPLSFDRAAGIYDATRGYPPGIGEQITAATLPLLPGSRRTLEIGIGTGRISLPLLQEGVPVTGIDVSTRMMAQLRAKLNNEGGKPDLVQAEAGWLPFRGNSFDAVFGVHVFHLVPDLEAVARQALRVLSSPGVILAGYDERDPDQLVELLRARWREIERTHEQPSTGRIHWEYEDVHSVLTALGARFTGKIPTVSWTREFNPVKHLEQMEQGYFSRTWEMTESERQQVIEELRGVVLSQFSSLDLTLADKCIFTWYRYSID
jgi:ubiquinone/menaquinone biosynthesis C-methylase UbiE